MAPNGYITDDKKADIPNNSTTCHHDNFSEQEEKSLGQRQPLKLTNIISITTLHIACVYALCTAVWEVRILTAVFCTIYGFSAGFGVTAGVHRLWAHRTYKAKLPLRLLLAALFSAAGQNTIPQWVLDHRVHHKFSETNADPHNSNRGFFFAHVGWLMQRKHPEVLRKGKLVDMSDVLEDPVVKFHTRYFRQLQVIFCYVLPTAIPCVCWGETLRVSIMSNIVRYCLGLNFTWLVNSAAHIYGNRPFSTQIRPAENLFVSLVALGEGWHNYHHVFPWDYKAAEMGHIVFNITTVILDFFARLGLAYDLKSPSAELVEKVARRYGDGSRYANADHFPEVDENGKIVADSIKSA